MRATRGLTMSEEMKTPEQEAEELINRVAIKIAHYYDLSQTLLGGGKSPNISEILFEELNLVDLKEQIKSLEKGLTQLQTVAMEKGQTIQRLELELGEAQQWLDSEPDWKDKFMANYGKLYKENTSLKQQLSALEQDKSKLEKENFFLISEISCASLGDDLFRLATINELIRRLPGFSALKTHDGQSIKEDEQPNDGFCDWCYKGMKEDDKAFYDANRHAHCSKQCVDDHEANR
jgi:hypothetical protein